jgi:hypothetical protein
MVFKTKTRRQRRAQEARIPGTTYSERGIALSEIGFPSYSDYLSSGLWESIRFRVFEVDRNCRGCGSNATQIHHANYSVDTLLGRNLDWLMPICGICHHKIEFREDGSKRSMNEANEALFRMVESSPKTNSCGFTPGKISCSKCGLLRKRKSIKDGVCKQCYASIAMHGSSSPSKAELFELQLTTPVCCKCNCRRETARAGGICISCRRRIESRLA